MTTHRQGETYFKVIPDDEGRFEIWEYVLRTIRRGRFYFTAKHDGITWGKRSKTHGDYGWLDPVPAWTRIKVWDEADIDKRFSKSKSQAIRVEIASVKDIMLRHKDLLLPSDGALLSGLERRLKREMKRKKSK